MALGTVSTILLAAPASAAPPFGVEQPLTSSTTAAAVPPLLPGGPSAASGASAADPADGSSRAGAPNVIPQGLAVPRTGRTYGQWSVAWWQYVLSIPRGSNPLFDETGALCARGQNERVFFLVGTLTSTEVNGDVFGTAKRSECKVPAGKPLFIPILNAECSQAEGNGTTESELRACAKGLIDNVTALSLEVDGKKVPGLVPGATAFRADSPLFTFRLPNDNVLGLPGGTTSPSVADGYYVLLEPLSAGAHTIRIHGEAPLNDHGNRFVLDVAYAPLVVGR